MPYRRQRKAATQVMHNLGDGTFPKGRARYGDPRAEQHARTQAEQDGHSARNAKAGRATHKRTAGTQEM